MWHRISSVKARLVCMQQQEFGGFATWSTSWVLTAGELQADRLQVRWIKLLKRNL